MFLHILIADILPIFTVMLLGFIGGKIHSFDTDQMQGFNKLVLDIALPAALFVSITKANREMLLVNLPVTLASLIGLIVLFLISAFLCVKIFKHKLQEGGVCALLAGTPTIGILGFAVLDPIWGATTEVGLVVAIVAIVVNAILIPIGYYIINMGLIRSADESQSKGDNIALKALTTSLKEPLVWVPLLAVLLVLLGIRFPPVLDPCFDLIAKANAGVAVFAAGLALASVNFKFTFEIVWNTFYRLILSPFLLLLLALCFGIRGDILTMFVIAVALPPAFSGIVISSRYHIYTRTGSASLAISTLCFALTTPFWIWATPKVAAMFETYLP